MRKLALLSISTLTLLAGAAVAPGLAAIAAAFPEAGPTTVKLVLTLPSIFIIPSTLLTARLIRHISKKRLLIIGLALYLAGGVGGGSADSMPILLLFRALLGIAVGLVMPLSTGLIVDFFTGHERGKMLGLSSSANHLGAIIATLSSGALASIHWRLAFGVYATAAAVLFLVIFYVPDPGLAGEEGSSTSKLPPSIYAWGLGALLLMISFYAMPVNLALFFEGAGIGGARTAGLAAALLSVFGILAGVSLSTMRNTLGGFMPPFALFLSGISYYLLAHAATLPSALSAMALMGLGFGWLVPILYLGTTNAAPPGLGVQAMATVSCFIYLGQFLSPVVLDSAARLWTDPSPQVSFLLVAAALGTVGAGFLLQVLGRSVFGAAIRRSEIETQPD